MKTITSCRQRDDYIGLYHLDNILSAETLQSSKLVKINASEYLISQNSQMRFIYFLVDGKLQIERYEINGNQVIFSFENAFSVIGDLELFNDEQMENNRIYSTIQALTECYLLALPIQVIQQEELNSPAFLKFICQQLSKKLLNASQLHSAASFSVEDKLRHYLVFAERQYGSNFRLENRESLAAMLGVSVRQLNRALLKLVEGKLIELKGKQIKIIAVENLLN